jgi:hypothetical protein
MSAPEPQDEQDYSLSEFARWMKRHPAISLFAFVMLLASILPSASSVSSAGFIALILGAGAYPLTGVLLGLMSTFSKRLLALTAYEKLRVSFLGLVLVAASAGVWVFLWFFLVEFYIQLTCRGAGCAQGGIAVFFALPMVWLSYAATRALSWAFVRFRWWPSECSPKFP